MFLTGYGLGLISGFLFILLGFWYLKKLDTERSNEQEDLNSQLVTYWKLTCANQKAQLEAIIKISDYITDVGKKKE